MTRIDPRQVEEIVVSIAAGGKQVIGFTSPHADELATSLPPAVAAFMARAGKSVLLIEFHHAIGKAGGEFWTISDLAARRRVNHTEQSLDTISIRPDDQSRYSFLDSRQLRQVLRELLEEYELIVIVLAPILTPEGVLNPVALGAACDYVMLTCKRGAMTASALSAVRENAAAAGCSIGGIVLNEREYPTAGPEIARLLKWLCWPLPGLRKRLPRWALRTDLLN